MNQVVQLISPRTTQSSQNEKSSSTHPIRGSKQILMIDVIILSIVFLQCNISEGKKKF